MAKLSINHLFATALVLIRSQRRKREREREREREKKRSFWIRRLFTDRAASGAYQSIVIEMKEIDEFFLGLFVCHRIDLTIY